MSTKEEGVVGVSGADSRDPDPRLGEDLVHRESDHVLGLDGVDLVPLRMLKVRGGVLGRPSPVRCRTHACPKA